MIKDSNKTQLVNHHRKSQFDLFTESVGWLSIAASPLFLSAFIGIGIYFYSPSNTTITNATILILIGIIIGIVWATSIWKKRDTINFLSKLGSTPDINSVERND